MQRFRRIAIGGIESIIIAIRTTSGSFHTIPVRTGKSGVYHHLLNSPAKGISDVFGIGIKSPVVLPGIHVRIMNYSIIQKIISVNTVLNKNTTNN
jgi:hypothetical protein